MFPLTINGGMRTVSINGVRCPGRINEMKTCPHCGNTDRDTIETNAARGGGNILQCLAKVEAGAESFSADALIIPEMREVCGFQWYPADCDGI